MPLRAVEVGRQTRQVLGPAAHERPAEAQARRRDAQREAVAAALARRGAVQHPLLLAAQGPHLTLSNVRLVSAPHPCEHNYVTAQAVSVAFHALHHHVRGNVHIAYM